MRRRVNSGLLWNAIKMYLQTQIDSGFGLGLIRDVLKLKLSRPFGWMCFVHVLCMCACVYVCVCVPVCVAGALRVDMRQRGDESLLSFWMSAHVTYTNTQNRKSFTRAHLCVCMCVSVWVINAISISEMRFYRWNLRATVPPWYCDSHASCGICNVIPALNTLFSWWLVPQSWHHDVASRLVAVIVWLKIGSG